MTVLWTDDLSVGDQCIDDDHIGLFKLINDLSNASMTHGYINNILHQLARYTEEHFSKEEEHMRKFDFPGVEAHLAQHEEFVEWLTTISKMYSRFPQSPFVVGDAVNGYLQRWLREHILQEDMKYRDFIIEQKQAS